MLILHGLTIKSFHEGLISKQFSTFEIIKEFFDYIEEHDKKIGAYLSLHKDKALLQANNIDRGIAGGEEFGNLAGVPLAIKDNILIEGFRATAASKILKHYSAAYDATVIKKLKNSNAIFLGKTNMDEFACGSSTENSGFQITKNPHDLGRVPGGSSGGSAASIAGNMAIGALGSDTGGSIREPASFCGVVGLKPTYGTVSRYGLMAMASSLDQIGPLTKTVEDAAILFNAIKGKDEFDATSVDYAYSDDLLNPKLEKIKTLKIGVPREYFVGGLAHEVQSALDEARKSLESLGIEFKEISLPHSKYALSAYYIIMPAEVSSNFSRFDGVRYSRGDMTTGRASTGSVNNSALTNIYFKTRGEGFGAEVRRRIMLGTYVLSSGYYDAYYAKAQKIRRLIKEDFDRAFEEVDVIFSPVAPTTAFKIGEKTKDPLQMYLSDIFTIPVNLAGLPAISIPVHSTLNNNGMSSPVTPHTSHSTPHTSLPIGFQLIGKYFGEADILGIGTFYERIHANLV
ncbi:MAG: Asp-tRNA(Asn)/Glu-tRNA(Gln) amidotransferase subunit GatA [bacterium]|nr:Asp-tRNA(Asn)/Glu-tRNA(Gln) amidotransferase subunit GatA [bacterium]